ncbi:MAG: hypothetical protein HY017_25240 [Betaproteobacteria bacterium]|nr:hypothetical protein [Betaproteobacteria bacterium]
MRFLVGSSARLELRCAGRHHIVTPIGAGAREAQIPRASPRARPEGEDCLSAEQIVFLPGYSTYLNSVDHLWAWVKRHALASYCPKISPSCVSPPENELKSAQRRPSITVASGYRLLLGDVMIRETLNSSRNMHGKGNGLLSFTVQHVLRHHGTVRNDLQKKARSIAIDRAIWWR